MDHARHINIADAELNPANGSSRTMSERQQNASAHALVAIAQLLEYQNNVLDRIADVIQGAR